MRHGLKADAKDSSLVLYHPNALGNMLGKAARRGGERDGLYHDRK